MQEKKPDTPLMFHNKGEADDYVFFLVFALVCCLYTVPTTDFTKESWLWSTPLFLSLSGYTLKLEPH